MSRTFRVLSIDGGGIRGIIPAVLLTYIEECTCKPIWQLFDLITGTSTGGILALGLTVPDYSEARFSARSLCDIYSHDGKRMFQAPPMHTLFSLKGILDSKYTCNGIDEVLKQYFDNMMLSQALTNVLITAYETERRIPWFFRSRYARNPEKTGYDFPMYQVARATSAAPTFFPPALIRTNVPGPDYYSFLDGGIFANNPAMCAYAEYIETQEKCDILMVSLGTGEYTKPLLFDRIKHGGVKYWAQSILDVVFDGIGDTVDYQLNHILNKKDRAKMYYRFQVTLPADTDHMDDCSGNNIRKLKLLGENLVRDNLTVLQELCKLLL